MGEAGRTLPLGERGVARRPDGLGILTRYADLVPSSLSATWAVEGQLLLCARSTGAGPPRVAQRDAGSEGRVSVLWVGRAELPRLRGSGIQHTSLGLPPMREPQPTPCALSALPRPPDWKPLPRAGPCLCSRAVSGWRLDRVWRNAGDSRRHRSFTRRGRHRRYLQAAASVVLDRFRVLPPRTRTRSR